MKAKPARARTPGKTRAKAESQAKPKVAAKTKPSAEAQAATSKPRKSAAKSRAPLKAAAKTTPQAAAKAKPAASDDKAASRLIDQRIADLGDWRGETLARMRALILETDPQMIEEWKWMGTPVWSRDGIVCTGESYKKVVKLTFARGASLADPARLFNSSLEGNTRRAIDIAEGANIDARAFKALVKEAVALNGLVKKKR